MLKMFLQELTGIRAFDLHNLFRCAFLGDQFAAAVTSFGAEINDPIGDLDDIEVVFDDQHRVAGID